MLLSGRDHKAVGDYLLSQPSLQYSEASFLSYVAVQE